MGNIVTVEANAILASSVAGTAYTLATKPITLALLTVIGDATTKGTEVANTGGSTYARYDTTTATIWGSASAGSITNSVGTATFNVMPACTIVAIELWDSVPRVTTTDGVTTSGSPNISAADGNFTAADVGQKITGTGIPGTTTTIITVTDSTHAVMSANASATNSNTIFTIVTPVRRWFGGLSANKTVNAGDTVTFATSSISITLS